MLYQALLHRDQHCRDEVGQCLCVVIFGSELDRSKVHVLYVRVLGRAVGCAIGAVLPWRYPTPWHGYVPLSFFRD